MSDRGSHAAESRQFDLRALYETSRLLSRSLDLEFVLNSLLLTAMSKLFTTRGIVLLYEPLEAGYRVAAAKGVRSLDVGTVLHLAPALGEAVLTGDDLPGALAEIGLALAVPIFFGNREIGMLAVGPKATGNPYDAPEIEFVRSLINMSSTAVHNSLMVEELKLANRDLDAKIQELNTLFDLSQEFNATLDRERLVKLLSFALMGQLLVSRHLFVLRRNGPAHEEHDVHVFASRGLREDVLEPELISALCSLDSLLLLEAGDGVDPRWEGLTRRGLCLALPLKQRSETYGALCLGPKRTGQSYGPDDVEFLSALGNLALVSIQNSFLVDEQIEKERLEEEMRLARRIQERLFPQRVPEFAGYEIAALAEPSRFVGGDYYDVAALEGERLLLAIADVTGKGVPASLLMANLQASLHVMLPMAVSIEEATAHINRVICENTDSDKFITFFHAILHRDSGGMDYVNAGHNPPMLVRADGRVEYLETGGLLLGVMPDLPYERGTTELHPGDLVALYTDGVTEAMNVEGEEYGEKRLEALLVGDRHRPAAEVLAIVRQDVAAFTDGISVLGDDLTIVVAKRLGS